MPPITTAGQAAKDRIAEFRQNVNNGTTSKQARAIVRKLGDPNFESNNLPAEGTPNMAGFKQDRPTNVQPTVTANDLANPAPQVNLTVPPQPTIPGRVDTTVNNVLGSIRSQSETARRLAEEQAAFQNFAEQSSGFDIQNQQLERFGVTPEKLRELEDIQLQLADRKTESNLVKTRIAGGAGQTLGQAGREVTQEDRESAVRDAGLAARAAVLQGNIETGRALANDAVNIALQDRTFQANAKLQQISQLEKVVDEETRQLLEVEKRNYEAELAKIQEVKDNVSNAIVNGASQSEIAQLNSPDISDDEKIALAQAITARGVNQMRNLEIESKRSAISANYASINLAERKFQYEQQKDALAFELEAMKNSGVITEEQAANQQKVEQALNLKDLVGQIRGHAGFNLSVGSPGSRVFSLTEGGAAGQLYNYLSGQGEGFDALYDQLTENLTLSNLDKMSGVLTDRDIQVLRSAATRLRKTTTEQEFLGVLDEMDATFQRSVDQYGVTPQQAKFYYGADQDALNEIDTMWDGGYNTSTSSLLNSPL
jgi:hypothetical protein